VLELGETGVRHPVELRHGVMQSPFAGGKIVGGAGATNHDQLGGVVSSGERDTGLDLGPSRGLTSSYDGQARGCPMRGPAYEPSPQVKAGVALTV